MMFLENSFKHLCPLHFETIVTATCYFNTIENKNISYYSIQCITNGKRDNMQHLDRFDKTVFALQKIIAT